MCDQILSDREWHAVLTRDQTEDSCNKLQQLVTRALDRGLRE